MITRAFEARPVAVFLAAPVAALVAALLALAPALEAQDLVGVVGDGADAGKLIKINPQSGVFTVTATTGLSDLGALTFDPARKPGLIAGTTSGAISLLDPTTGTETSVVDALASDSTPPQGVSFVGVVSGLLSLDVEPVTFELFAVVQDALGSSFLATLDLGAVDASNPLNKKLKINLVGLLGSTQGSGAGFSVSSIAFDPSTRDLYGAGIDLKATGVHPTFVKIQTTPSTAPLAIAVGQAAKGVLSFPLAMAFFKSNVLATGFQGSAPPPPGTTPLHALFAFDPTTGSDLFLGALRTSAGANVGGRVTGMAVVTSLPPGPALPPKITSFSPAGGNCGTVVTVRGQGYSASGASIVSSVQFGGVSSLTTPIVVSDGELRVLAPGGFKTGKIKVVTSSGGTQKEALSATSFVATTLVLIKEERSQGVPGHAFIEGKDAVFRLLTASSASAPPATKPIPAIFEKASLTITRPVGNAVTVAGQAYTRRSMNSPKKVEPDERRNINFYVSGAVFSAPGTYTLDYLVEGFKPSGGVGCGALIKRTSNLTVAKRGDDVRVLLILSGVKKGGKLALPGQKLLDAIPKIMDEFSRTYPVRDGVSRLGQGLSAGVRFDIASSVFPLRGEGGPGTVNLFDVFAGLEGAATKVLGEYNTKNSKDPADFVAVFADIEAHAPDTVFGLARENAPTSVWLIAPLGKTVTFVSNTAVHEVAHNLGLVEDSSPNRNPSNPGHSKNRRIPTLGGAQSDPTAPGGLRPFNVPGRFVVVGNTTALAPPWPAGSIMFDPIPFFFAEFNHADGRIFFEKEEYADLLEALVKKKGAGSIAGGVGGAYTMLARIAEDDTAEVLVSHESTLEEGPSPVDPASPYTLAFIDAQGQVLSESGFPVSFRAYGQGEVEGDAEPFSTAAATVRIVRPLPAGTAEARIIKSSRTLAAVTRSESPPTVSVVFPSGGETFAADEEVTIEWLASDPDTAVADLRFGVSYSPDGERWSPIDAAISGESLVWRTAFTPGSPEGQLRVTVTDGFHTAESLSGFFRVEPKPPMAAILRPEDGQSFLELDTIVLDSLAFDTERGVLDDAAHYWTVSGVALGTGRRLLLEPGALEPGTHLITLDVDDGDEVVTREISISVLADSDGDGLSDGFEEDFESQDPGDPDDAGLDVDFDGLTSSVEHFFGTDPESPDSDGDGIPDGVFVPQGGQLPGDCNQDGKLDIADPVCVFIILFGDGDVGGLIPGRFPCGDGTAANPANLELLDFNGDGMPTVNIADGIAAISYLFFGSAPHPLGTDCVPIVGCPQSATCP